MTALESVAAERRSQDARFGTQNHPNGTGPGTLTKLACLGPTATEARENYERAARDGRVKWSDVLWEEFAEALEETDPVRLRAELVQVAAVACAWVEALDRQ